MSRGQRRAANQAAGTFYAPPSGPVLEGRLRALDRPGEHLWVISTAWACPDPERIAGTVMLDAETLIGFAGPGCYKCERVYTGKLAKTPCTGSTEVDQ